MTERAEDREAAIHRTRLLIICGASVATLLLIFVLFDPLGSSSALQFLRIVEAHDPSGIAKAVGGATIAALTLASSSAAATGTLCAAGARPMRTAPLLVFFLLSAGAAEAVTARSSPGGVLLGMSSLLAGSVLGGLIGASTGAWLRRRPTFGLFRTLWRGWLVSTISTTAGLALIAATAVPLFVHPALDDVGDVNAIVVLGPVTDRRMDGALALLSEHPGAVLVLSTTRDGDGSFARPECAARNGKRVLCFTPSPFTTRGEIAEVKELTREYRWSSIALLTSTPHVARVRVIASMCLPAPASVASVEGPRTTSAWTLAVAYQTIAFVKLLLVRSC
ncbi:YdcF family protein [Rathayibacter sp. SD072]|uniref:YdcF family protein n=1 Tax=Rathayibacter sp. SD072 TaxID=2781731 RepID=UPI001A962B5C|nr:ElyC/SanA/YdcF family protein [Rathayibacter sp. SD072]MBO0982876.1 YdcF family protein [Rathayibacter sp. SD072]